MTNELLRELFRKKSGERKPLIISYDGQEIGSGSAKAVKWNIKVGRNPFLATKQPKKELHEKGIGQVLAISMKTPIGEGLALLLVASPPISFQDARAVRIEDLHMEEDICEILCKPRSSRT